MKPLHILAGISIVLNVLVIAFLYNATPSDNSSSQGERTQFPYLSSRIFVDAQNDLIINFVPLRLGLKKYAAEAPHRLGLYFEYLPVITKRF